MPVKIRPSEQSAAQPTVWSVSLGAGVPRGTASIVLFAASMSDCWAGVRGIIRNLVERRSLEYSGVLNKSMFRGVGGEEG